MNNFERKPRKNYGFIYKYTSPSGKGYVGQTIRSLKERAKKNGVGYLPCTVFFRAIQKYGFENFKVEILGEFRIEILDEKEKEFILKENTLAPNGYNLQKGGAVNWIRKNPYINQFDLDGNFIKQYKTVIEAADDNDCAYQAISAVLNKRRPQYNGFIYRYDTEPKPEPFQTKKTHGRITAQYDLEGNLIATYKSASEAARATGGNARNIRLVCDGKRKTTNGYKWKYLD